MPCMAVAFSGGRDSTALLHATVAKAREHGVRVVALHVHHGLSPHADAWLLHCEAFCRRLARRGAALRFVATRLQGKPAPGQSIEAWARRERYRALRAMALAHGAAMVLLAHHRRDQAETFLLQALRGGGVAGQAAMPREIERAGVSWMRPWLDAPRTAIDSYLKLHRLDHIDDQSNDEVGFARNRLRLQVWPALCDAFPDAELALSNAAKWAQQARDALQELAQIDLAQVVGSQGLELAAWRLLSIARRSNVLRAWLGLQTGSAPSASLVERLLAEADRPGVAQWGLATGDGKQLQRFRGWLRVVELPTQAKVAPSALAQTLRIGRAGTYRLAGYHGRLRVARVTSRGVALRRLGELRVVARSGGEQFQIDRARPARSLKKQYQSLAIPAGERNGPLLYVAHELIFVSGLGIDARAWAQPEEAQVSLTWIPEQPAPASNAL